MSEPSPVVIDNGSGICKAGFAGDDNPKTTVRTVVGHPSENAEETQVQFGEAAFQNESILNLKYPIERGIVSNWDDMEKLWKHLFDHELCVSAAECPVLLSEAPRNPKINREKTAQIMFESLDVPALFLSIQGVLAMYSAGRTTGIVLDSGAGLSQVVPIFDGYSVAEAVNRVDLGGQDLTKYLMKLLGERDYAFTTRTDHEAIRDMKENLCYVAADFDAEEEKEKTHKLPDGQVITVANERFRCPEALFQPSLVDPKAVGVHELLFNAIMKCDVDIRRDMYTNMVVTGGGTSFPGFVDRLHAEVGKLAPASMKLKTITPSGREHAAWIGGSILASLGSFQSLWISKRDYQEYGADFINKKCPC